jgi:TolB-like protein
VSLAGARADEVVSAGDGRVRVVILPMVVNTAGERAYLRSGLSDMLASRLGRNAGVAVVRIDDETKATSDPLRAAALGVESGARFVVFGAFTQFGEGASLDVQCVEARAYEEEESPSARRIFIQSGTVGEIIPKLDATAQKIGLFVLGEGAPAERGAPAPAVATAPSAPAQAAAPAGAASGAAYEDLRRRLEALEEYLFGDKSDRVAEKPAEESDASQQFELR